MSQDPTTDTRVGLKPVTSAEESFIDKTFGVHGRCAPPLWHNTLTDVHGMKVTPILVTDPHAEKLTCELCHETLSAPRAEDFPST